MRLTTKKLFSRFARDERGATLVEYGIAVVLAVIVGTGGLILMADQTNVNMTAAQGAMVGGGVIDCAGSTTDADTGEVTPNC